MAISFAELSTLPDILPNDRHILYFPNIPGTKNRNLTLTNTQVTVPTIGTGHIRVRLLGHSIGFAGGLSFDNSLQCTFYEVSDGSILKSITTWLNLVRDRESSVRTLKAMYAENADLDVINSMGNPAFTVKLHNIFPVVVTWPEFQSGQSGPTEFQVTFNVDSVEYVDGTVTSAGEFATSNSAFFG